MSTFELSENIIQKLDAFKKIMEVILEKDMPKNESERIELIISIGLERMLVDILPKEEMLIKTITEMFDQNPKFVCNFIFEKIKQGEKLQEQVKEIRSRWQLYA